MVDPNIELICKTIAEVAGYGLLGWAAYLFYKFLTKEDN